VLSFSAIEFVLCQLYFTCTSTIVLKFGFSTVVLPQSSFLSTFVRHLF